MGRARQILILLALLSLFFGYLTYQFQLENTPFPLSVFVPDCPLYVSLMVLAVFFGVKNSEFRLLVGVGMVKYGIWTLMIFILYSSYYWEPSLLWQTEVLFLGHILMVWGGLIMLPERPTRIGLVIAAGWFLLNDVMDYGFGLRPAFPEDFLWFVERFSFASTIIFSFALYYWCGAIRRMRIVAWGRKSLGVS